MWSDASNAQTLDVSSAGTYSVIVTDANGCTASDSIVSDILNADITQNDTTICEGDSLVLSVNGSGGFDNNVPGNWKYSLNFSSGTLNNGLIGSSLYNGRVLVLSKWFGAGGDENICVLQTSFD